MDFVSIIIFIFLYFIRPQEWMRIIYDRPVVRYTMILALLTMLSKHRGMKFSDVFKTPHDWAMLLYVVWVIFSAPTLNPAFNDLINLSVFYLVIVQALHNRERLKFFVVCWTWLTFAVAALALASEFGFDPMGSYDLTHGEHMQGRLCLNNFNYNNPNSLGHGIIPVIPMLYFLYIWHKPVFITEPLALAFIVPVWATYLTQSRGAFVAGVSSFGISQLFGRPKIVQIFLVVVLIGVGPPIVKSLRHYQRPDDRGSEASVEGRKTAFRFGFNEFNKTRLNGLGYRLFTTYSPWKIMIRKGKVIKTQRISSHSAYVAIGAEQGVVGLYLWLFVFYCSLKTLIITKCKNEHDDRIKRCLFSAVVAFLISSWFIDIPYSALFFIISAVCAAFHRVVTLDPEISETPDVENGSKEGASKIWNKTGLVDMALVGLFLLVVRRVWQYLAGNM